MAATLSPSSHIPSTNPGGQLFPMSNMSKQVSMIAAMCKGNGIGANGNLPWRLKKEMAFFTRITSSTSDQNKKNAVVMGRKTWDSIPPKYRPLEGRVNVVISKTLTSVPEGADLLAASLSDSITVLNNLDLIERIFIVGGSQIYKEGLLEPKCDRIYLTKIDAHFECDTFFPDIDESKWTQITDPDVPSEDQIEKDIRYKFHVYQRVK